MSKAIREAEKRAREREAERMKTMRRYYEPLPSPPPRGSSSNLEEEKWKAKAYFRAHAGYSESKERLMKFMDEAGIIHKEEVLQQMINERQIIYDPKAHMWQYTLKFIAAPEEEGEGSSGNPDRKKLIELLYKLQADEIEAESKYRDAAKFARVEARSPAIASSLDRIGDEELEHRKKVDNLIGQLEVY